MQQKSFEQLYRMLNLINHKQINKVNIKEAIRKADRSGVLLTEEESKDVDFDLDFDFGGELEKETAQLIKGGSDPKFYANEVSSKVRGSSRDFDMPYRMYLLRAPYGQIQLKVNGYNGKVKDNQKIHFDFDENNWIKTVRESKVGLGTIGIPGHMTEIGKFILEFMSRVYTNKLNPTEKKFDSVGSSIFASNEAKNVAEEFIKKWLNTVVFNVARQVTKSKFTDEVNDKIILSVREPAVDFIMKELKRSYSPERANFFAWSLEVMKNIIINQFRKFGKRNVENTDLLTNYFDSLKYPLSVATNKEFNFLIERKFGTKDLTPGQWKELKEMSNSSFEGIPEKHGNNYVFIYNSSNDIINDILSSNKNSGSEDVVTLCPLYVRNIESKSIKDVIFKSDLKPSGEEKHDNTGKITVNGASITFDKSKFESENPSKSIVDVSFPKNVSDQAKEEWKQNMVNNNWFDFVEAYDKERAGDDATLRSKGISTKDNSDVDDEQNGEDQESFEINLINPKGEDLANIKEKIAKLQLSLKNAKTKKDFEKETRIRKVLGIYKELESIGNTISIKYNAKPERGRKNYDKINITSIVDGNGEEVKVSDDLMEYLKRRARKDIKEKVGKGDVGSSDLGGSEDKSFEDQGEERLDRFKKIMGTPKFIQKFVETIETSEDGEGIADRFKGATVNKINELKTLKDKKVIIEFYAFLGDLIAESILAVGKPFAKGAKPKVPGIDTDKKSSNSNEIQENMIDIYEKSYKNHIEKLSKTITPEELEKAKEYFKLSGDNLKRIAAAINTFMYASAKKKKSNFSNMGLDEAKKMLNSLVTKTIKESVFNENEIELDEERISNEDGAAKVNEKENFIGSQVFGEDIGNVGNDSGWKEGMYGVFSYGEQFPIYIYTNMPFKDQDGNTKNNDGKFRWFNNVEEYKFDIDKDGEKEVMSSVEKHKELLKPHAPTHGLTRATLENMVLTFKKKNGIKELSHTSILPGQGEGIHFGSSHKKD